MSTGKRRLCWGKQITLRAANRPLTCASIANLSHFTSLHCIRVAAFAGTFGPRTPWIPGIPAGIQDWNPENDPWELYNLKEDWSQANDLAAEMPEKLQELKRLFLVESARNNNLPIGGGL